MVNHKGHQDHKEVSGLPQKPYQAAHFLHY